MAYQITFFRSRLSLQLAFAIPWELHYRWCVVFDGRRLGQRLRRDSIFVFVCDEIETAYQLTGRFGKIKKCYFDYTKLSSINRRIIGREFE